MNVYTFPTSEPELSETEVDSDSRGDPHCPMVATTTVVSTSESVLCRLTMVSALSYGPSLTARSCHGRQKIPSARMEDLLQHLQTEGFSEEFSKLAAAPRRLTTN